MPESEKTAARSKADDMVNYLGNLVALNLDRLSEGDGRLRELLNASLGRVLMSGMRRATDPERYCAEIVHSDRSRWDHVRDWIRSSIFNGSPWIANVNDRGIPKKLAKLGSLDALVREADKQMARANMRIGAGAGIDVEAESVEMEFPDGWKVVRLLTPSSLDRESVRMQHCIGHGGYDERLEHGGYRYLSLRDPANKPHATMELLRKSDQRHDILLQLQGKQNRAPLRDYMVRIADYLERSRISLDQCQHGMICDRHGKIHFYDDMPDLLEIDHPLLLTRSEESPWIRLPRVIRGRSLSFIGTFDDMPEEVTASVSLNLDGQIRLPDRLHVEGQLTVSHNELTSLPADLHVGGLVLIDTPNLELPPGLVVDGMLSLALSRMSVVSIPSDTRFRQIDISNRNIRVLDTAGFLPPQSATDLAPVLIARSGQLERIVGEKRFSRLELAESAWTALPEDLVVTHLLDISNTGIAEIPQGAVPQIMLLAKECFDLTLPSQLDCERVDLTGATVRLPDTVECVGELVLESAKIVTMATSMKAELISLEKAEFRSLPQDIETDVLMLRLAPVNRLPRGLKASNVSISSGPLQIEEGASFDTLAVSIKMGIYNQVQKLTLPEASKAVMANGGVGIGPQENAPSIVLEVDDIWISHYRYFDLSLRRDRRMTGEEHPSRIEAASSFAKFGKSVRDCIMAC